MKAIYTSIIPIAFLISSNLHAACLGLGFPAPQSTNVCETIVERTLVPRFSAFCDIPWWARIALPNCNLPGACHVDPLCKSFETVQAIGSAVLNSGDLYCDVREINPEKIVQNLGNSLYTDVVKLTTGGLSSILYTVANAHIDILECGASPLNQKLKEVIRLVLEQAGPSLAGAFESIDIDRVRIVSRDTDTSELYLTEGYDAITLDSVVILRPHLFDALNNWAASGKDFSLARVGSADNDALSVMIHELVHVQQYRHIGREQFINVYLAEALAFGYSDISSELEAENFQSRADEVIYTQFAKFIPTITLPN